MTDYPIRSGAFLTPGGHQVTMFYRDNTNDFNTLNATLNEDEYHLPHGLTGQAVDVGGYLGSVGIALALDNPDLLVTIIEPVPPNAELCRENIRLANVGDRVTLIEGAVGRKDEPVTVWYGYRGSESVEHHAFVGNSTLAYDNGGSFEHESVVYPPITLDDLTADGDLAYLKIDCEGAEWAFLEGPVERVGTIVGEAHAVRGHKGIDIVALLDPTHHVTTVGDSNGTCEFSAVRR